MKYKIIDLAIVLAILGYLWYAEAHLLEALVMVGFIATMNHIYKQLSE